MEAVLFIGIQATGKSTFYKQNFVDTHIRINLDMLKTRQREAILLNACLEAKQAFVVDNTNPRRVDRQRYIPLVKAAGFTVIGYYFQSKVKEALVRNQQRIGKACIPEQGIRTTFAKLEMPSYSEAFDQLYYVTIDSEHDRHFQVYEWKND